ncbi:MAG: hypothetical protein ACOYZ8_15790 [Chloroflexota bacterium]
MTFPDNCLRGISAPDQLEEGNSVSSSAFNFSDLVRDDGWRDLSINWHDDEGAIQVLLNQKKADGEIQFRVGYAVIPREELDHLIKQPTVNGMLTYERHQIDNNPYHGNILVKGNLPKPTIRKLQAGLALLVSAVFRRP